MTNKLVQMFIYFFCIAFLFMSVSEVEGHSFVVEESPVPNSVLASSPSEISIRFNSKVDKNFSLKVWNENNQEIVINSSSISEDQKLILVQIPQLPNGIYRVEYYIISSTDGHTVEGSYAFQVKWKVPPLKNEEYIKEETVPGIVKKGEPTTPQEVVDKTIEVTEEENISKISIYISKSIYYLGFLLLVGWVFLWQLVRTYSFEVRKKYIFYGMIFQVLHLIGLIAFLFAQMNVFTIHGIVFEFDFPVGTNFGKLWIASLVFGLFGFLLLFKNSLFDYCWVLLLGIIKSLNGHTQEFEPTYALVALNCLHLFAASFLVAGIIYIALFWRKQRIYVKYFLPVFSQGALYSIILLTITGSITTYFYLPNQEALLTDWGIALLAKIAVVVVVVILGAVIRRKMKKGKVANLESTIKLDVVLMLMLIVMVSILTSLNPLP